MSGADEEWVKAAMTDDTMVVELLVRLHGAAPPPPLKPPAALPLEWSVRQRRSRPVSVNNNNPKKQAQRASPTTPLSWSGATSLSGGSGGSGGAGGGGSEESSRPSIHKLSNTTRSKVNGGDSEKTASKRSRKKKTLAELKDEENSLLKERRELKRELSALRVHMEKQRVRNENFKRMKIELQPIPDREMTSAAEASVSGHPIPPIAPPILSGNDVTLQSSTSNDCPEQNADAASDPKFVLPDLNIAFEEDPCPDVICGVS